MRVLNFTDGFESASAPTQGSIQQNSLASYATDAAYVSGKGSAATEGDAYYNSTYDLVRVYQNSAWRFITGQVPSFATAAAYVTGKGSSAENGDYFYDSTNHVLKVYQNGGWHYVRCGVLPTYATDAAYVTAKGSSAANGDMYYDSTNHVVRCYQNGAWNVVRTASVLTAATEAAFVTAKAVSAAAGDVFVDTTYNELKYYDSKWNTVPKLNQNWLINSDFWFWQRGVSLAGPTSGNYQADRWQYLKNATSAVHTYSRSTDIPTMAQSGHQSTYSLLLDCTTADAALGATDVIAIRQAIEGYLYANLKGKTVTLTFWVKATKTGTYCVAFHNSASDRSYVAEYTVSSTDTWEKKTITITINPSAGTDNYVNGVGLRVHFTLMSGSTYQTTANAWQTGEFYGTSSQVNACDDAANNFRLSQVKLELGSNSSPFQTAGISPERELALCQRYYEQSYDLGVFPGGTTGGGYTKFMAARTTTDGQYTDSYAVCKRTTPTVKIYSGGTGVIDTARDTSAATDRAANGASIGQRSHVVSCVFQDQAAFLWAWTADAEL